MADKIYIERQLNVLEDALKRCGHAWDFEDPNRPCGCDPVYLEMDNLRMVVRNNVIPALWEAIT